jgi:transcription initiation factor TFIIIB Brf1 subunit/transcription initiation factor TFIIB
MWCPTCAEEMDVKKIIYDFEAGEQICYQCGTVIGEQRNNDFFTLDSFIDSYHIITDATYIEDRCDFMMGHESKYYGTKGSGLSGVGGNVITSFTKSMDFSSSGIMSSLMDEKNVDFNGVRIKDTKMMNRLRHINNITTPSTNKNPNEKNIKQVVMFIKQISQKHNFPPHIQENTVNMYRDVIKKNKERRLQYKVVSYWCLYYVLRSASLITSLPEFLSRLVDLGFIESSKRTHIQKKINKVQVFILELLDLKPIPHSDYIENIMFLCNNYGLSEIIKRQCVELGHVINESGGTLIYQGRSPRTIATLLIAIVMTKEGMKDECKDLLKELKITPIILKKVLAEVISLVRKRNDPNLDKLERLHASL